MRRDHFHTDEGIPVQRVLQNDGKVTAWTDERVDKMADWVHLVDVGSRNATPVVARDRHRVVRFG